MDDLEPENLSGQGLAPALPEVLHQLGESENAKGPLVHPEEMHLGARDFEEAASVEGS